MKLVVCLITSISAIVAMPVMASAQGEFAAGAFVSVLQGILSYEGVNAWKRFKHIPNEVELQRKTVEELAAILGEKFAAIRYGQATSYLMNAKRELEYYINNPKDNKDSLNEARTQSGYAINEFGQMGPQALHPYCLAATLHMAILQEKMKTSENPEAEKKNIILHIAETKMYIESAQVAIIKRYKWDPNTLYPPKRPIIIIPGTLELPAQPTPAEVREAKAREGVRVARLLVRAFDDPKAAYPLLQAEIERMKKANAISNELTKGLTATPPSMSPAAVGSLAVPIGRK